MARRLTATGHFANAIEAAYAAIAAEPLRESGRRALIEAHLAEGNRTEALVHAASYRTLLAEEYGMSPSLEFERLVTQARSLDRMCGRPMAPN